MVSGFLLQRLKFPLAGQPPAGYRFGASETIPLARERQALSSSAELGKCPGGKRRRSCARIPCALGLPA